MAFITEIVGTCSDIITDPYQRLSKINNRDDKFMGYTCIFAPEEIIHAAGYIPVRLFADYKGSRHSEKYIPAQSCEYARGLWETFRSGKFNFLEGCVLSHCCDVLWGSFWELGKDWTKKLYYIHLPFNHNSEISRDFYTKELERFKQYMVETFEKKITDRDLERSVSVYRENSRLLRQLQTHLYDGSLNGRDYFTIQKAGYFIRREEHNEILKKTLETLGEDKGKKEKSNGKPRILLTGFLNGEISLLTHLEKLGMTIASDDLCEFSRYIPEADADESPRQPIEEIADRYISKFCPLALKGHDWFTLLKKRYIESRAEGIIFLVYPFCDPQSIEYIHAKHELKEAGIHSLFVQPDINFDGSAQLDTRVNAFLEMLTE